MIYAIGDLHLDNSMEKPMDIFGDNWLRHEEQIFNNWKSIVRDDDLVLLPGDISWALKLEDAYPDLLKIDSLPGKKIMIKGNHDYWWDSLRKIKDLNLKTIEFIQNNSFIFNDIVIAGTRGWYPTEEGDIDFHNRKIFLRELNRLKLSLESIKDEFTKKIVLLHYPPFNIDLNHNEFVQIMKDHNVDICLYGHLHADGHKSVVEGVVEGIDFHCVSSDYIDFIPKKIL